MVKEVDLLAVLRPDLAGGRLDKAVDLDLPPPPVVTETWPPAKGVEDIVLFFFLLLELSLL